MLELTETHLKLNDLVLVDSLRDRINRIVQEQKNLSRLKENNLRPRQRLLFTGPPGCGKTITAAALANELRLPLFVVRLDSLISRYLGESLSKLRLIFEAAERHRAVYLFDEFDSIGFTRDAAGDVGEMRRVLNAFLVFIEKMRSNSLVIAATNYGQRLDKALFRRFDDLVEFGLPDPSQTRETIKRLLRDVDKETPIWTKIEPAAKGLSYAEITKASRGSHQGNAHPRSTQGDKQGLGKCANRTQASPESLSRSAFLADARPYPQSPQTPQVLLEV